MALYAKLEWTRLQYSCQSITRFHRCALQAARGWHFSNKLNRTWVLGQSGD